MMKAVYFLRRLSYFVTHEAMRTLTIEASVKFSGARPGVIPPPPPAADMAAAMLGRVEAPGALLQAGGAAQAGRSAGKLTSGIRRRGICQWQQLAVPVALWHWQ